MSIKDYLGLIATVISVVNLSLYIRTIMVGRTKPHAFSWLLWCLVMSVIFIAQFLDGAGAGSWQLGVSAVLCGVVGVLALKHGDRGFSRSDWVITSLAVLAIPLWLLTKDPLASVILLNAIDLAGYYPTFRKAFHAPYEESLSRPFRVMVMTCISTMALERYDVITLLYPISILATELALALMLMSRRKLFAVMPAENPAPSA